MPHRSEALLVRDVRMSGCCKGLMLHTDVNASAIPVRELDQRCLMLTMTSSLPRSVRQISDSVLQRAAD